MNDFIGGALTSTTTSCLLRTDKHIRVADAAEVRRSSLEYKSVCEARYSTETWPIALTITDKGAGSSGSLQQRTYRLSFIVAALIDITKSGRLLDSVIGVTF